MANGTILDCASSGAIRHAKYKELPAVRARRIKTIEADKRKQEREKGQVEQCLKLWESCKSIKHARLFAGRSRCGYLHCCKSADGVCSYSAWDVLRWDEERYRDCPAWTVEQVQERAREVYPDMIAHAQRWIDHCNNRLAYERAMLGKSGGIATDRVKPEKGGACKCWCSPGHGRGWSIIQKVNKVSVTLLDNWGNGGRNFSRTISFDKLRAVMSRDEVEEKRGRTADRRGDRSGVLPRRGPGASTR